MTIRLRRRLQVMMSFAKLDWSKTVAYTDGQRPEIWINLRGRQPEGIVEPEEYDAVCQRIIDSLTAAVCVKSGHALVRRVWRREEAYSGPFVNRSPDLVVEWTEAGGCLDIRYPDGSTLELVKKHLPDDPYDHLLNGGHDQFGLVALKGPGVAGGRIRGADIADIAPTILFLRDAAIPSDVDGKVLDSALDPDLLSFRAQKRGGESLETLETDAAYSDEEQAEVRERLKALGYVE